MMLNRVKKIKKHLLLFWVLLIFNIGFASFYLSQKQGFFVDELWSYGHANSSKGAFLSDEIDSHLGLIDTDLHEHWIDGKVFHDYLTTQENERFKYGYIWDNLQKSVHPPLFYVLLHTVCSFMPDRFSPWQVGSINLIALLLTLVMFYKLSGLFIKDEYLAMAPVFWWGFSGAGLAMVVFLRMYALQTLFAVCLLYEISKMLLANEADKKRLFLIFLYAALGNLTQYFSLVFAYVTAVVAGVILLYRKNWRLLGKFAVTMLMSVVVLFIVEPQAYNVLLHSQRGADNFAKITGIWENFKAMFQPTVYDNRLQHRSLSRVYFSDLLGIRKNFDAVLLLLVLGGAFVFRKYKVKKDKKFVPLYVIMLLMAFILTYFVPYDVRISSRYYLFLMPLAALVGVYFVRDVFGFLKISDKMVKLLFVLIILWQIFAVDFRQNMYFMPVNEETIVYQEKLKNKNILYVGDVLGFFENSLLFSKAKAVYFSNSHYPTAQSITAAAIAQADYVFIFNVASWVYVPEGQTEVCFMCRPKPFPLEDELLRQMKFVTSYRSGVFSYDVYEVIKK